MKRFIGRDKNPGGFTLVEIMVAIVVLAVGLLSFFALNVAIIKSNVSAKMVSAATNLAQEKIENIKNTDYSLIVDATETNIGLNSAFTRTTSVQTDVPQSNMKTITVTVSWQEMKPFKSQKVHSISLTTSVSQ